MIRNLWKIPDGRDWLWGKLGLVLIGKAMLSKSLIQFSVDGWGCVPSLLFGQAVNPLETPEHSQVSLAQSLIVLQIQITWQFSVPLWDHQIGESVVHPRDFLTVQEFLGILVLLFVAICSVLYSGVHGNFLKEGLCHMLQDPGLLQTEPLSPWQATADPCLCKQ